MLFINAFIFDAEKGFLPGSFSVEEGRFRDVRPSPEPEAKPGEPCVDLRGAYVIPGLIDIHTHGCAGADFSDGDPEGLQKMCACYAKNGVTAFAPTSMTLPYAVLERAFVSALELSKKRPANCARIAGINMEGPYFSDKKKGAQNGEYLKAPDVAGFRRLWEAAGGLLRIVDLAPELPGACDFTAEVSKYCRVSAAHSDASYEEASAVFNAGATQVTHLFNGMPPIHHRKPGIIGAAAERDGVVAELICDGLHIHPSVVRIAFKLFPGRICVISDSLRCAGMPDGEYELGGQKILLSDNIAKLADGTIAGSATNLFCCLRNILSFGIDRTEAIRACTIIPARQLGVDAELGSIESGKCADFVICDSELNRKAVYIAGEEIK